MAQRKDTRKRKQKVDPRLIALRDLLKSEMRKSGYKGVIVDVTDDMTEEEQEMALFEGYLKEGHPPDVAEKKAKDMLAFAKLVEERLKRR